MFDILDLTKRRKKEVFSGTYYAPKSEPSYFEYRVQSNPRASYSDIINNLIISGVGVVIATSWALNWKEDANIVLQDGNTYFIKQIETEFFNDENQRFLKVSPRTEYVLALAKRSTARPGGKTNEFRGL